MITIELKDEYAEEVFDLLCEIPFETPSMTDLDPPTTRHQGIEDMIFQLQGVLYPDDYPQVE